ncbi:unnamed protein product [Caenorhabditis brenneri]
MAATAEIGILDFVILLLGSYGGPAASGRGCHFDRLALKVMLNIIRQADTLRPKARCVGNELFNPKPGTDWRPSRCFAFEISTLSASAICDFSSCSPTNSDLQFKKLHLVA